MRKWMATVSLSAPLFLSQAAPSQTAAQVPAPRDYRGVSVRIPGIFVTPVPNAPFSAQVDILSHEKLPDGAEHVVSTRAHIARSSSGLIRNERRLLVPASFTGEPRLLEVHLYDPSSRRNTFYTPETHLARETILPAPPVTPRDQRAPVPAEAQAQQQLPPDTTQTSLGTESLDGLELQGIRKIRTIPSESSGTGKPVEVVDEYWYSPALSMYMTIRHNDPRTGEQLVAVTHVERAEPPATDLTVPSGFKVVDETPPVMTQP